MYKSAENIQNSAKINYFNNTSQEIIYQISDFLLFAL